ncbi:TPA: ATP-binding cassette domain-containing protein [Corynebacterium striatum]|nr:ATP-binding cassette domain-containing protein [Corynebacterium striatum]
MITVSRLTKQYRTFSAINDLTFTVPDGAITGFLGPNGAGKSTTMRCMLGLDCPTAGNVLIDGRKLSQHAQPARAAGAVLDTSWFHAGRSGLAHLEVVAASAGLPRSAVHAVLEEVGMSSAARRPMGKYSLGMKQRLGIATAMLGRPRNLILDEPMNGLDPEGMLWMRSYLTNLATQGHTVFISSHLLSEIETLADRILIIGQGHILGEWNMKDFVNSSQNTIIATNDDSRLMDELRNLGVDVNKLPNGLEVSFNQRIPNVLALSRKCHDADILITSLGSSTSTLQQAFLELTATSSDFNARRFQP